MNDRLVRALLVLAGSLAGLTGIAADRPGASIGQLSWLSGCWESVRGDRHIEEQWMAPRGGTMFGLNRTVAGGRTSEYEFMDIREQEGRLVFTARPSGQRETSFGSIELAGSRVVFENAAHDFPQRVIYQLNDDGTLLARIEGKRDGVLKGVDFPMRRTPCAGNGSR